MKNKFLFAIFCQRNFTSDAIPCNTGLFSAISGGRSGGERALKGTVTLQQDVRDS
jgi:hypothetical protein